jgi:hypothetical protein
MMIDLTYFFLPVLVWDSALPATDLTDLLVPELFSSLDALLATALLVCFVFAILSPAFRSGMYILYHK